ncbi:hypothetical protein CRI93_06245 [Longimonas halophila]|uniref:Uncharacterized protein n=1 Tax=Longimonas halophila TaxID=1469170 RepID=A0A2H3NMZ0_9BACT|nr:hypothetical protein CRI93_06245 [Longimonas halophila]
MLRVRKQIRGRSGLIIPDYKHIRQPKLGADSVLSLSGGRQRYERTYYAYSAYVIPSPHLFGAVWYSFKKRRVWTSDLPSGSVFSSYQRIQEMVQEW